MFTTLLESRAARPRRAGSTVTSALLHGATIAAIVAMTVPGQGDAKLPPEKSPPVRFIPIAHPPRREPPMPHRTTTVVQAPATPLTRFIIPPIDMPNGLPPIEIGAPPLTEESVIIISTGGGTHRLIGPPLGVDPGGVMDELRVDRSPRILAGAPEPRYPSSLRSSGVTGHVVIRFVVDTLGRAEMGGVTTVETTHVLFANAVQEALGRFRFTPGEIAGRKVRTMVQVPFTFALR